MRSIILAWLIGGAAVGAATLAPVVALAALCGIIAGAVYAVWVWAVCAIMARL